MYADYAYYHDSYGGKMGEEDFRRMGAKASRTITLHTLGRAYTCAEMADNVRDCECALADVYLAVSTRPPGIASESNDGGSVSYTSYTDVRGEVATVLREHLTYPVNLMYRGYDDAVCP